MTFEYASGGGGTQEVTYTLDTTVTLEQALGSDVAEMFVCNAD